MNKELNMNLIAASYGSNRPINAEIGLVFGLDADLLASAAILGRKLYWRYRMLYSLCT